MIAPGRAGQMVVTGCLVWALVSILSLLVLRIVDAWRSHRARKDASVVGSITPYQSSGTKEHCTGCGGDDADLYDGICWHCLVVGQEAG